MSVGHIAQIGDQVGLCFLYKGCDHIPDVVEIEDILGGTQLYVSDIEDYEIPVLGFIQVHHPVGVGDDFVSFKTQRVAA